MNNLLFLIQQLFLPVFSLWPVWVLVLIAYVLVLRSRIVKYASWLLRLGIVFLTLVLVLRLVLLVALPFGQRTMTLPLEIVGEEKLPLSVHFRYGELKITYKDTTTFNLDSYDSLHGYAFEKGVFADLLKGEEIKTNAIVLRRKDEVNLLTKVWSTVGVEIPSEFTEDAEYRIEQANALLDFTYSKSAALKLAVLTSNVQVYLPRALSNQSVDVKIADSRARIYIPEGPTYLMKVISQYRVELPTELQKVSENMYRKSGDNGATVTLSINSLSPKTLEVILLNEHNK